MLYKKLDDLQCKNWWSFVYKLYLYITQPTIVRPCDDISVRMTYSW